MRSTGSTTPARSVMRRAFTMAEAAVCTVIVGVMLGAAIETVGAARAGQVWNSDRLRALALASAMIAEITDQHYNDPASPMPNIGPGPGENQAIRTTLNDVDDYHGIDAAPTDRGGAALPGLANWRWRVQVAWVSVADPTVTSSTETGVKRITVTVSRRSVKLVELVTLRTAAVPR